MTRRRAASLFAGLLLTLGAALPALAHAELVSSDPPDKAVLTTAPTTITLTFSEALDPRSKFNLIGPGGNVGSGAVGTDPATLLLDGLTLAPGAYEIQWTSVADDGHIERGTLTFTVAQPSPPPASSGPAAPTSGQASAAQSAAVTTAPTAAPSADPGTVPQPAADSSGDVLLPIVAAFVLVAGVGVILVRRSRRA